MTRVQGQMDTMLSSSKTVGLCLGMRYAMQYLVFSRNPICLPL
ncbi:hypothetical protein LINPERHAP2_LOCUS20057 [Linum perenne]